MHTHPIAHKSQWIPFNWVLPHVVQIVTVGSAGGGLRWQNEFEADFIPHCEMNMGDKWKADELVSFRSENLERYKRNFLKQAVCELRFPTLMELGNPRPPAKFVSALRKEFPTWELQNEVAVRLGDKAPPMGTANHAHVFRSVKATSAVSLKPSALTFETTAYSTYANFREKLLLVVRAAAEVIDTDFFTRIGLRYVNVVDVGEDPVQGWINEALVGPISHQGFQFISDFAGRVQLSVDDGGCLLQHGLRFDEASRGKEDAIPSFVIDIDTYRNEVVYSDVEAAIDAMHSQAFNLFDWSISEKARTYLSTERPMRPSKETK